MSARATEWGPAKLFQSGPALAKAGPGLDTAGVAPSRWIYGSIPRCAIFYCQVLYFHAFHIFTLNWYSQPGP